jgi:hypothetical protein
MHDNTCSDVDKVQGGNRLASICTISRNEDMSSLLQIGHFLLHLFIFPVGRQRMESQPRYLELKNTDPPAKRHRLMEEAVATEVKEGTSS